MLLALVLRSMPVLSVLLLVWGMVSRQRSYAFRRTAVQVTGEIVTWTHEMEHSTPTIRFTTLEGQEVVLPHPTGDTGRYPRGPVPVWYEPGNPEHFESSVNFTDRPGTSALLMGAVLLAMSLQLVPLVGHL